MIAGRVHEHNGASASTIDLSERAGGRLLCSGGGRMAQKFNLVPVESYSSRCPSVEGACSFIIAIAPFDCTYC